MNDQIRGSTQRTTEKRFTRPLLLGVLGLPSRATYLSMALLAVTMVVAAVNASEPNAPSSCETVELIKSDLSGWIVEGKKAIVVDGKQVPIWTVEDGTIHCAGSGKNLGFLRYDQKVDDFELHVEYKFTPGCNSGIGFRTIPYAGTRKTRPSQAGFELQILDEKRVDTSGYKKPELSMSIYGHIERPKNVQKPDGKWNVVDIRCQGPHIRVVLNGEELHNIDQRQIESLNKKPMSGYICLQDHGHVIDFRNIRLKRLLSSKDDEKLTTNH